MTKSRENLLELLGIGGASIILWACTFIFTPTASPVETVAVFAAGLSIFVNQTHFTGSYALLYGDFRKNLLRKPRYFWAGIVVPMAMLAYFIYALAHQRSDLMAIAVKVMFFLVGWHYVKQIFGCVIVGAVRSEQFYSKWEKRAILANLLTVWFINMIQTAPTYAVHDFNGIKYTQMPMNLTAFSVAASLFALTFLVMVGVLIRKYIKEGALPSPMGMIATFSIYIWFLPSFHHPSFTYMVPFFHSLQYLVLSGEFKYNKETARLGNTSGEQRRKLWFKNFIGFWLLSFVTGLIFFSFLPNSLDKAGFFPDGTAIGPTPFLAAFLLFINIHHYFIDNAIWRHDNEEIRRHLFHHKANAATTVHASESLHQPQSQPLLAH